MPCRSTIGVSVRCRRLLGNGELIGKILFCSQDLAALPKATLGFSEGAACVPLLRCGGPATPSFRVTPLIQGEKKEAGKHFFRHSDCLSNRSI